MGLRVLLVDDSATVRSLVQVFLMGRDFEYSEARSAEQALAMMQSNVPDIVITDLNMPGMDGIAMIRKLRSDPRPRVRTLPIILLTSDKTPEVRARAREAGTDVVVAKPVTSSDLQEALARATPANTIPPSRL